MRVLYISMEYHAMFSGNGTASMSFVRSLRTRGADVFVLCAAPVDTDAAAPQGAGACVPVPTWGVHGQTGPWESFADGCVAAGAAEAVRAWLLGGGEQPVAVVGVDWEGMAAYRRLVEAGVFVAAAPPHSVAYYNYRVFYKNTGAAADEVAFYAERERACMEAARMTLCLCDVDAASLRALLPRAQPRVILPGLRGEMAASAAAEEAERSGQQPGSRRRRRRYLLCCVRVIREKNVAAFVEIVRSLATRSGCLGEAEGAVVPYMVGAAGDAAYAAALHGELRAAYGGSVVVDGFLGAAELAEVMAQSVLNVHPALNEAYGMTIVEAAAMGCPSVVHEADIGATHLLAPARGEVFCADMRAPARVADAIAGLLGSPDVVATAAAAAQKAAVAYDEAANAATLHAMLSEALR